MTRQEAYTYYGGLGDQFEYGNLTDAECIRLAGGIIRDTLTETDSDILECIFHALFLLVTHRKAAAELDLRPLTENWQRFDSASLEYLPAILAETGDLRYLDLIRQIGGRFPQIETAEEIALLQKRAAQRS